MASGFPGDAVHQINRLFRDGTAAGLTDGQLLERFATHRAEVAELAFEALVIRHGPMVLRVVRGVLRDPHDVDDAFQATFLVLVRKARSIGERDLLGPWLYGVAHRVALKARGVAARRQKREGTLLDDPPADPLEGPWLDLRPILHEELNRLPDKYRKPVILCHLQGLTHAEAAQELAWPVGTVSVRLARARKLLKERLTRRGLTITAGLWAAGLSLEGAGAAVPDPLIRSTTTAALQAAAGKLLAAGAISTGSFTLTKRTLTMMLMSRLKWMIVPLAVGLGATGGVLANREIMLRSIRAKAEFAAAEARKPPVTELTDPNFVPKSIEQSPMEPPGEPGQPPAEIPEAAPWKVEPPVVARTSDTGHVPDFTIDPVPPGFFDLPAPAKNDGTDPPIVKPGQIIQVEVLDALPGRPISGERLVRPDGTISLGFYGDLRVAGLNRYQIKVKMIEHLCQYINVETLGLIEIDSRKKLVKAIPPVESDRVFVDESLLMQPAGGEASNPRGMSGEFNDQVARGRLRLVEERIQKAIERLKSSDTQSDPAQPPDAADPRTAPKEKTDREIEAEVTNDFNLQINLSFARRELKSALEELGKVRGNPTALAPAVGPAADLAHPSNPNDPALPAATNRGPHKLDSCPGSPKRATPDPEVPPSPTPKPIL